jgi:predicted N-formylglutamate amidohydrolase
MTHHVENRTDDNLLGPHDPQPVQINNPTGRSSFLFLGDHAGNRIPTKLGTLGLCSSDLRRHIAWDIGIEALGRSLAQDLDAVFISQAYSRLVVDCNRNQHAEDAISRISDGLDIPGNNLITSQQRSNRLTEIYDPYHATIFNELNRRATAGMETILVSLHSFTPTMNAIERPWEIGLLYDKGNTRFAITCLNFLQENTGLVVGDNKPYKMDEVDYTIPHHAYDFHLPYAELEIRQDLLESRNQVASWTKIISKTLLSAARGCEK